MRASLWPTGLIGRVGIVLFAAVLLELVGSSLLFEQAEVLTSDTMRAHRIAEQLDSARRVLTITDTATRANVAQTISDPSLQLSWRPTPPPAGAIHNDTHAETFRAAIVAHDPSLEGAHLSLRTEGTGADGQLKGTLRLDDGSTMRFATPAAGTTTPSIFVHLWSIALLSGCVLLAALLVVRTLAAPLRMLVRATDAIGHGPSIHIDENGPREIRRVARAFNAMQDRIARLVRDRTQALAAVSHDLRTPLGRMRLRAGFLAASDDQKAFESDLAEMEAMLNDLLAYLGGETDPEKPRRTDIAAVLTTLVDAATDAGHPASYAGPDRLTMDVRALALKRAFANIINNAVAYGDRANVVLEKRDAHVVVFFRDDGPGIPQAELAAVFEPFYRVDAARNRAKGGMGLGLAITRQAIWREGGTIALRNRAKGGLEVAVTLPRTSADGPPLG